MLKIHLLRKDLLTIAQFFQQNISAKKVLQVMSGISSKLSNNRK